MPDLGREYHPMRLRRAGITMLVLFAAGLAVMLFGALWISPVVMLLLSAFIVPFIFMGLSGLTAVEWELDPSRPDQRSAEAKQARHLRRMGKARSNNYMLCLIFFIDFGLAWLLVGYWGWTYACQVLFIPLVIVAILALALPLQAARTVYTSDMQEHWVFVENGVMRQKSVPRLGHYRISPFRADQVKRAVWSTSQKGEDMFVHFQMVRPEEQVVYPVHQDIIRDEAAFKAFLQGKLEEKDVPSGSRIFPSDG